MKLKKSIEDQNIGYFKKKLIKMSIWWYWTGKKKEIETILEMKRERTWQHLDKSFKMFEKNTINRFGKQTWNMKEMNNFLAKYKLPIWFNKQKIC